MSSGSADDMDRPKKPRRRQTTTPAERKRNAQLSAQKKAEQCREVSRCKDASDLFSFVPNIHNMRRRTPLGRLEGAYLDWFLAHRDIFGECTMSQVGDRGVHQWMADTEATAIVHEGWTMTVGEVIERTHDESNQKHAFKHQYCIAYNDIKCTRPNTPTLELRRKALERACHAWDDQLAMSTVLRGLRSNDRCSIIYDAATLAERVGKIAPWPRFIK